MTPRPPKKISLLSEGGTQTQKTALEERIKIGRQYFEAGRSAEALTEFKKVLKLDPKSLDALQCIAAIAFGEDDFNKALAVLDRLVRYYPRFAVAHNNRGLALLELKQTESALNSFERAIALKPGLAEAHFNLGNALGELGRYEKALASYNEAIQLNDAYADAYANRGNVYRELKRFDEALESFEKALFHHPNSFEAYFNHAKTQQDQKQYEFAVESYQEAIRIRPNYAEAHYELGKAYKELLRLDDAKACYEKAIQLNSESAKFHHSFAVCLGDLQQFDQALIGHQKAIALDPLYLNAYIACGVTLSELMRFEEAIHYYDQAIKINSDSASARLNRSLLLLLKGDFKNGFKEYEYRWDAAEEKEKINEGRKRLKPLWLGNEALAGKTLFVYSEQGFGDVIHFCRYIKNLANLGAKVVFGVPIELRSLLSSLDGVAEFSLHGDRLPHYDFQCPLLSLPLAFKTDAESIPALDKYLVADGVKVTHWQKKLHDISKPKVGIVWSGSTGHKKDFKRSILLKEFIDCLPEGFQYICLQKEIREADQEILALNPQILSFADGFNDFSDTAALIECLDLVISVDTSVAHLSAALGKPTWILLPTTPDWRWLLNRSDSPWYPSVKLYRQKNIGQWGDVFNRISEDLKLYLTL